MTAEPWYLNLNALAEAVRKHLSHEIAAAIPATAATMAATHEAPELIADSDLGELLLRILMGGLPKAPVELSAMHLTLPTDVIAFDPADAKCHPMFVGMPDTLTGAVGAPVIAGARGLMLSIGFPTFRQVDVVRLNGEICGALHFIASGAGCELFAMAQYGRLGDFALMQTSAVIEWVAAMAGVCP